MQADQMTMVLRERAGLEGADLGGRLLQQHFAAVYRPWLIVMIPVVCVSLATGLINPYLAWFVLWWLAPVGERIVVLVLSRAAFQQQVTWKVALRDVWKTGLRGIVWQLTILRLSPFRCLLAPVMTLERPSFSTYRQRAATLVKDQRGALGATLAFGVAEIFILLTALMFLGALMPQHAIEWRLWLEKLIGDGNFGQHLFNVFFAVTILFVRPFYAAAGFGLYLSRRTELEGWDIELTFRGMARRFAEAAVVLIICCSLGGFLGGHSVSAAEHDGTVALSPVEHVGDIVALPPYKNEVDRESYFDFSWLKPDGEMKVGNAPLLSVILRTLAVLLLGGLIYLAVRACMKIFVPADAQESPLPDSFGIELFDEDLPESLPGDPGGAAAALAREGRLREALSLLIRAGILHFRERAAIPIPSGATEGECLRRIRGQVPANTYDHFRDVTRLWQTHAYAARPISADQVVDLATDFQRAYTVPQAGEGAS